MYENSETTEPIKNITLAKSLESATFVYENNKLKTEIIINGITYKNNFSI